MKYKMIATDFDSTLLSSDKKVSENNKNILLDLKGRGYYIVGVTARNLSSVKSVCDINMFNYLILSNGNYIYDVDKDKGESINSVSLDTIRKLFDKYKDNSNGMSFCSLSKYYIYTDNIGFFRNFEIPIDNVADIKEDIHKINIFVSLEDIDKCRDYIKNNCRDVDSIIMQDTDRDNSKWVTIAPYNVNKYTALQKLCNKLNISVSEVIFFGDSGNDLEIISGVGMGVAMSNALPEIKKVAKEITLSNDKDGVYVFLNKIFDRRR